MTSEENTKNIERGFSRKIKQSANFFWTEIVVGEGEVLHREAAEQVGQQWNSSNGWEGLREL